MMRGLFIQQSNESSLKQEQSLRELSQVWDQKDPDRKWENKTLNDFYWKSNHFLSGKKIGFSCVAVEQLRDKFQVDLLKQHISVITYELMKLCRELEYCEPWVNFCEETWLQVDHRQFMELFLDDLLNMRTFHECEAVQFKNLMQQRKDWRKLFCDMLQNVDRKLFWEVAYLFFTCANLLTSEQKQVKLNELQLEELADRFWNKNDDLLHQKLQFMKQIEDASTLVKKLTVTILLMMNGYFLNKFFSLIDEECCIKMVEEQSGQRPRKIRVINCKRRIHSMLQQKNLSTKKQNY